MENKYKYSCPVEALYMQRNFDFEYECIPRYTQKWEEVLRLEVCDEYYVVDVDFWTGQYSSDQLAIPGLFLINKSLEQIKPYEFDWGVSKDNEMYMCRNFGSGLAWYNPYNSNCIFDLDEVKITMRQGQQFFAPEKHTSTY